MDYDTTKLATLGVKPVSSILETLQCDPEDSDYITPSVEGAFAVITKGL